MIKLYVDVCCDCEDKYPEYEISEELAEFLRFESWGDSVDEMEEEDKTSDEFRLEMDDGWISSLLWHKEKLPENLYNELKAIVDDISSIEREMAVAFVLDEYPPSDWDVIEKLQEDMDAGLFTPTLSFKQFLKEDGWGDSDEDDEYAKEEYLSKIAEDEYEDWVETLPPYERAERYGLDEAMASGYARTSYTFLCINKAATE